MNYIKVGSSNNYIVFLHGWGADKNSFFWLKDYFKNYSLIFVDFAGFGESHEPDRPYYVSDYVDELKGLLDNFEIANLILVGHSFGGRVAIKYAFCYQYDYCKFGLVLVDSAGIKPRRGLAYKIKVARYKKCKKLANKAEKYAKMLNNFGSADYKAVSGIMRKTLVNVVNENLEVYAKAIKCDTILVWGTNDQDTKLYMAKKLLRLIKGSRLFLIEGAGHFSFLDNPNQFLIILDTFVKNF